MLKPSVSLSGTDGVDTWRLCWIMTPPSAAARPGLPPFAVPGSNVSGLEYWARGAIRPPTLGASTTHSTDVPGPVYVFTVENVAPVIALVVELVQARPDP